MESGKSQPRVQARCKPLWQSFFPRQRVVKCEDLPQDLPPAAGLDPAVPPPKPVDPNPPLQFENFSREWMQMSQQDNFDGFRIEAANQVTKYLQAAHTLFLGTSLRETGYIYQFGPMFATADQRTVLIARYGLDGGVNGRIIQKVGESWEFKASSNSSLKDAQRNMHEGSIEYNGAECTFGSKLAWQGAPIFGGSFTQRILPSLQMGGDLTLIPVNGVTSIGQIGMRWAEGKDIFTAALSRTPDPKAPGGTLHEARLQYVRKLSERLSLATEFKYSHPEKESGLQMAYEYTFRNGRIQGLVDTDYKVSCCVQDFQGFGFSGTIDYAKSDYKFGCMMHIVPQPEGEQPMM